MPARLGPVLWSPGTIEWYAAHCLNARAPRLASPSAVTGFETATNTPATASVKRAFEFHIVHLPIIGSEGPWSFRALGSLFQRRQMSLGTPQAPNQTAKGETLGPAPFASLTGCAALNAARLFRGPRIRLGPPTQFAGFGCRFCGGRAGPRRFVRDEKRGWHGEAVGRADINEIPPLPHSSQHPVAELSAPAQLPAGYSAVPAKTNWTGIPATSARTIRMKISAGPRRSS